jgi:hypothetical protein
MAMSVYRRTSFCTANNTFFVCRFLACNPVIVDAARLTAQHRIRLFWGNIPGLRKEVTKCAAKLADYLMPDMNRTAVVEKIRTVTTNSNSLRQGS